MIGLILGIIKIVLIGVAVSLALSYFGVKQLKEIINKIREKCRVAFGSIKKLIIKNAKLILDNSPNISKKQLDEISEDDMYFVANYDEQKDSITDFTTIKAEKAEGKLDDILEGTDDGVVILE